ncbi:MAG: sulfotransferase family protein [Chitinophagaceae bacterium]|nr:sulfotransferase family protein [Chitinophagaceae bacterium]
MLLPFYTNTPNWLPYKLRKADPVSIQWIFRGEKTPTEPFFDDTLNACRGYMENSRIGEMISTPEDMIRLAKSSDSVKPGAFIFHISRCGSTLLSQLLAMDKEHISLSEVPVFDAILRSRYSFPSLDEEWVDQAFRAAVQLHSVRLHGVETTCFIKTDCWHIFYYEQLRRLYPGVPFILLYRSPDEVLRSQQKKRGMQSVPGIVESSLMGISDEDAACTNLDFYFSRVMENILAAFCKVATADPLAIPVNYSQGMEDVYSITLQSAGIDPAEKMDQSIRDRIQFHGKYPDQPFSGEDKIAEPDPLLVNCFEQYRKLESVRIGRQNNI